MTQTWMTLIGYVSYLTLLAGELDSVSFFAIFGKISNIHYIEQKLCKIEKTP